MSSAIAYSIMVNNQKLDKLVLCFKRNSKVFVKFIMSLIFLKLINRNHSSNNNQKYKLKKSHSKLLKCNKHRDNRRNRKKIKWENEFNDFQTDYYFSKSFNIFSFEEKFLVFLSLLIRNLTF